VEVKALFKYTSDNNTMSTHWKEDEELSLFTRWFRSFWLWLVVAALAISGVVWVVQRGVKEVEAGIVRYEEFQSIYNTCAKLDNDLKVMRAVPEDDKMFEQFSKNQRITGLQANLNRWIEEYNAKSRMINHSLWKSSTLPQQLTTNQFPSY
jgi:hypothetical protein